MTSMFSGLRVLDLSTVLAGPSVATFFAELGAHVVKIENPRVPDVTRSWKLPLEDPSSPVSAYFCSINYGKEYRTLDLSSAEQRPELEELIRWCDVMITNFKHGDDAKFHLTWPEVKAIHPSVILAQLTGYHSQPERVAYDVVLQAETGFMYMNGTKESGPVKMPVAMVDVLSAHQMKEGILCALINKEKTGRGAWVTCTLEESGLSALVNQAANYLMTGHVPQRIGSLHPNIAPYGETFVCADEKLLVVAIGSDKQFGQLCKLLGQEQLMNDQRFETNVQRVQHRAVLAATLALPFSKRNGNNWIADMHALNIPAGIVKSMDEVMQNQTAQQMILHENSNGTDSYRMKSAVFRISHD
jgi:crotonobetainyl-CoA:carnitine CoA-transferase CaiB-like acyl-CoA transferase